MGEYMGSTVLTPAEVALHPRTQDSPPPPSCLRKPTSSTPSPTPPSSSSRRPSASWTQTRTVYCRLLTFSCICCLWQECWWWRDPGHARRSGRTNELHTDGYIVRLQMAGGSDDDDVILASFECFENDGKIDADTFRHSLMTFGVKFSASEVDDAFAEMKIDDGQIDAAHLKGLMVAK